MNIQLLKLKIMKLYPIILLVVLVAASCRKNDAKIEIDQARNVGKILEESDPKDNKNEITRNVAYSTLTELTNIDTNVYACYYSGIMLRFKNLVYDVNDPSNSILYGDLFWTDKANNITIVEGINFSSYFRLNEYYCATLPTFQFTQSTETIVTTNISNKMILKVNGSVPTNPNVSSVDISIGNDTKIYKLISQIGATTGLFSTTLLSVSGGLCGQWQIRETTGKLMTKVVDGVRKFYVAPINYPDFTNGNPPE